MRRGISQDGLRLQVRAPVCKARRMSREGFSTGRTPTALPAAVGLAVGTAAPLFSGPVATASGVAFEFPNLFPAPASRHNPWDTLTHDIASISPSSDTPSFQIDRNDWPFTTHVY